MGLFEQEKNQLFEKLQDHGNMVLSTSLHDRITSRMMSVIVRDQAFYFQTDRTFRKYFPSSYERYTNLEDDRLFILKSLSLLSRLFPLSFL